MTADPPQEPESTAASESGPAPEPESTAASESGPAPEPELVRHVGPEHVDDLLGLFAGTYWAADRDREDVETLLVNSDELYGLVEYDGHDNRGRGEGDRLVGFARVLTDYTARATVSDVVVADDRRGEGLGARLVDAVVETPELATVDHLDLVTRASTVAFYERWGFTADLGERVPMRRG